MTKADDTYQNTKVQLPQGADRLSIDSDGMLDFYGDTVTGKIARDRLYANHQRTTILSAAGALSVKNLTTGYTYLKLSSGASNASAWLPSCTEGDEVFVVLLDYSTESLLSVFVSLSGCSLVGIQFSDLSSISLHTSAASAAWIHFKCFSDDEWAIAGSSGMHLINQHSIS